MSKNELRENLAKELSPMFEENAGEEVVVEEIQEESVTEEENIDEVVKEESSEPEEEKQDKDDNEDSLPEIDRLLSGYPKDFKELVKSISDPELQKKAIETGKIMRAREDKLSSELGEQKKQNQSLDQFKRMFDSNPRDTILQIAKMANLDLKELVEPIADEDDEYLLPEERKLRDQVKKFEKELQQEKQFRLNQEQRVIDQEINQFASNKEKYPHFEDAFDSIVELLAIENKRNGFPVTSQERVSRLEKAYNKAILLDDNLLQKRDSELLSRLENKRKADVDKAKTLKKVAVKSANAPVNFTSRKEALEHDLQKLGLI